jgi:ATP-dependent Clp protease ATP-binding subunit ClpA
MRKSVTTRRSHPEEQEAEVEFLGSSFPCNSNIRKETHSRNLCVHHNPVVIAIANLYQSVDLTELAKSGKLDPVIGRDEGRLYAINSSSF